MRGCALTFEPKRWRGPSCHGFVTDVQKDCTSYVAPSVFGCEIIDAAKPDFQKASQVYALVGISIY